MQVRNVLTISMLSVAVALSVVASCAKNDGEHSSSTTPEGPGEKAGRKVDEAGHEVKEAAEKVGEKTTEAGRNVADAGKGVADAASGAVK